MTSFAKFRVEGPDAEAVLQRISANDVAVPIGRIVYTQWLNDRGGIEADLTITRLGEVSFLIVTAAASAVRDLAWLRRHIPQDSRCVVFDVTSTEGVISIMGPNARALLQPLVETDLSSNAFPFGWAKPVELGPVIARAHRITYVGELGWELYIPTEMMAAAFECVASAGSSVGLVLCGFHALDSCRIEKAYRHFGHDIADDTHVLEAGLGFAVKTDKSSSCFGHFIGREAVLRKRESGLTRRLLQFKLKDPEPLLYQNEPIWVESQVVGRITSGQYGHHLGAAVGLGYVECRPDQCAEEILGASYSIEVAGDQFPAVPSLQPLYDPASVRIRL
jgi:glycine cleavage system aminomethyltransferase T